MPRPLLVLIVAAATGAISHRARAVAESTAASVSPSAGRNHAALELIQQLGDEQFAVRRRAEEQLIRLGPEALDDLRQAEESPDLEIAERARYILLRMRVEWVRPTDSADVRRALARYGDLSSDERIKRIARLAELPDGSALAALCRIARLDASPIVARRAALAALKQPAPGSDRPALADACQRELGLSERPSVIWLKLWQRETADRRATLPDWDSALQAEAALLNADSPDTAADIVYPLMKRHLETCRELGLVTETAAMLLQIVDLWTDDETAQRRTNNLAWALNWIIDRKCWSVLDEVVARRGAELRSDRKLLYYLAAATSLAGRADEAARLAEKAFTLSAGDAEERVDVATAIVSLGFIDWAEREFRRALQDLPVVSWDSLRARREWAMWLYDRQKFDQAASVLDEFFQAYKEDRAAQRRLDQQLDGRDYVNAIAARAELYRACALEAQRQFDRQREALDRAWQLYDDDPDVLIAMYHSEGADVAYRAQVKQRIQEMSVKHLALIEQYPDEPSFFNQWAWLVSNTEGDFAKAVEYSQRSLELSPDEPSYLDTLGRCYYAAGDLKNAVKTQRRAVELSPHYGVMQRQLQQFERELAAKQDGSQ
ncbi:MAG: hypothetical protein IT424_07505 [Pirellulales bacterium]|nr:hypothetical protein [Pirellulales bacterium]